MTGVGGRVKHDYVRSYTLQSEKRDPCRVCAMPRLNWRHKDVAEVPDVTEPRRAREVYR